MSTKVDNPSFLTLAAAAALAQFDKELADLEASDYYKDTMTATKLQHCVGTSLANERGDIEHPPPMNAWPKPCLDTRCICGHRRTWCSYNCHHADLALETTPGRSINRSHFLQIECPIAKNRFRHRGPGTLMFIYIVWKLI